MSAPTPPPPDPFRPDEPPERSLHLARAVTPAVGTLVEDGPRPRARSPRFRRPAQYSLVGFVLAAIGLLTVGRWVVRQAEQHAPALTELTEVTELTLDDLRALLEPSLPAYAPPPPEQDAVLLDARLQPHGARLLLDGHPAPSNPVRIPRGQRVVRVVAWAPGYLAVARDVVPDVDQTIHLRLRPLPETKRPARTAPPAP